MDQSRIKKLNSNISKYYLFKFLTYFHLFIPVLVLFFQENNLSTTEIFILQSVYSISIIVLEIPTGAIGDYFGRKVSVSLGVLLYTVSLLVFSIGDSFSTFLIGELISGLGVSFMSGSNTA